MDCPNCGTWNPDDKHVCWRCQTDLPTPQPKKERKNLKLFGLPVWAWVVVAILLLFPMLSQCAGPLLGQ